ncbi:DUF4391 domain-containing protein [Peptacetobacter sp.]|uniref:DUF4391 domain-containing protein n=1 Tax=Peptacetobacter sp. TaxID=2991975 RepID=UPI00261DE09B|nr:DUF4391 domain-containing protein [Peptacetobacter sp.]
MLGLPKATELNKQLPKKAIYAKFKMNTAEKEKMDKDISRITIVNEVSPSKVSLSPGKEVQSFFVILVALKRKDYSEKTINTLSNLIPQNLILVLQYDDKAKLAIYRTKLLQTEWKSLNDLKIHLQGLDFDKVWENVVLQIAGMNLENGNSLDAQIEINSKKEKIKKEIEKLEKQARAEKQPKKKFALVSKIKKLKNDILMFK